jgi:hypothetical protein
MDEIARWAVLLAIAGVGFTALGGAFAWFMEPRRRMRRSLKKVLGADPHALLVSRREGKGIGFDFGANTMSVTWDVGAWCLKYSLDELMGAELIVDDRVTARAHRGEARRAQEHFAGAERAVRLRFTFDDARYPDFIVDLWNAGDDSRNAPTASEAVQEGVRWIARVESILRRPTARRPATAPPPIGVTQGAPTVSALPIDAGDDDHMWDGDVQDDEAESTAA